MATSWALPVVLSTPLSGREAVADALYRCIWGIDTNDLEMYRSAFTAGCKMTLNDVPLEVVSGCYENLAKLDTTHGVTNMRISLGEEGSTASMTATVTANHYRRGEGLREDGDVPSLLVGALYRIELERDGTNDGGRVWKIKEFHIKSVWREGTLKVIED